MCKGGVSSSISIGSPVWSYHLAIRNVMSQKTEKVKKGTIKKKKKQKGR